MARQMTKDEVFEVVKKKTLEVLLDVSPDAVDRSKSLKDLGANSIDRSEITMASMEALGLRFPLRELASVRDIDGLVNALHGKLGG